MIRWWKVKYSDVIRHSAPDTFWHVNNDFFFCSGHKGLCIFPMLIIRIRLCRDLRDHTREYVLEYSNTIPRVLGIIEQIKSSTFFFFLHTNRPPGKVKIFWWDDTEQETPKDKTLNSVKRKNRIHKSYFFLTRLYNNTL